MDWFEWHRLYESRAPLQRRLKLVRRHISECLNLSPPGEVRIISVCAGDGRDLVGALKGHHRAPDVRARLVELDERLVLRGREAAAGAGLSERLEFLNADATSSRAYEGIAPANLLLLCGMLGHLDEPSTLRLVRHLPALCQSGGFVVWTRNLNYGDGNRHADLFRSLLRQSALEEVRTETTHGKPLFRKGTRGRFLVSTYRYRGECSALPPDAKLFELREPA